MSRAGAQRGLALGAALGLAIALGAPAAAESAEGLDARPFHSSLFAGALLGVDAGALPRHGMLAAGMTFGWSRKPLAIGNPAGGASDGNEVVSGRLEGDLVLSLGLFGRIEVAAGMSLVALQDGDRGLNGGAAPSGTAPGDARLGVRAELVRSGRLRAGLAALASLPVGDEGAFAGAGVVTAEPRVWLRAAAGRLEVGASAGALLREAVTLKGSALGNAGALRLGARFDLTQRLAAVATLEALVRETSNKSPVEAMGGVALHIGQVELTAAAGAGLTDAAGTAALRAVISLRWPGGGRTVPARQSHTELAPAPGPAPGPTPPAAPPRDPHPDRDDDGLVEDDSCPEAAGPRENRGCPDRDDDQDGLVNRLDKCPAAKGVADNQGCPDLDQDQDGIADRTDKCPAEKEVFNGKDDDDGCPDQGEELVVVHHDRIEIRRPVRFDQVKFKKGDWRVNKDSFLLLATVAKVMILHPEIKRLRIVGHTDDQGSDDKNDYLSLRRAEAIRAHLIEVNGVEANRIEAEGRGEREPIADNQTAAGRALNRRVELLIVERAEQP